MTQTHRKDMHELTLNKACTGRLRKDLASPKFLSENPYVDNIILICETKYSQSAE